MALNRGFGHEGTRRRAFFSPMEHEWKDVTCLGILATDWLNRPYFKIAPMSLWGELFARHQREREQLLQWEAVNQRQLLRSASMETVRVSADSEGNVGVEESGAGATAFTAAHDETGGTAVGKGKKEQGVVETEPRNSPALKSHEIPVEDLTLVKKFLARSEEGETEEELSGSHPHSPTRSRYSSASNHSLTSNYSLVSSLPPSDVSEDSQWDLMDPESSATISSIAEWSESSAGERSDWEY